MSLAAGDWIFWLCISLHYELVFVKDSYKARISPNGKWGTISDHRFTTIRWNTNVRFITFILIKFRWTFKFQKRAKCGKFNDLHGMMGVKYQDKYQSKTTGSGENVTVTNTNLSTLKDGYFAYTMLNSLNNVANPIKCVKIWLKERI